MIQIKRFFGYNDLRNFSYLFFDDATGEAWAIDPYEGGPIKDYIRGQGLNLAGILNTHQHYDHIRGNSSLIESFDCEVMKAQGKVRLGEKAIIYFIASPGHTMDHQVFLLSSDNKKHLFSGDTFFNAGVGNCKNGGDVETLYLTTQKLLAMLDESTLLYPGHDYSKRNLEFALQFDPENKNIKNFLHEVDYQDVEERGVRTMGEEKRVNPFFSLDRLKMDKRFSELTEKEIFFYLRQQRDNW